jgi:ABC-type nitrate/sulfonate/bicarbonate transport system substrate-binding protein
VKIRILLAVLFVVGLVVLTACDSPKSKKISGESVESLTVGTHVSDLSSLIWLAKDRGYFSEQGLDIKLKAYDSGVAAIEDLLAGNTDLATASEFVVVRNILERPDLRILSSIDQTGDMVKLVARKDHGITQISDIRNKRIGLLRNSMAEYYLDVLMTMSDIPSQDIQIVDLTPSEQVIAITKGEIDALIVWEHFAAKAENELGTNVVSWPAQSEQDYYWLLACTAETIKNRSSSVHNFLAALALAEDFIKKQRHEAEQIVASQLGSNHTNWKNHIFRLQLDRSLLLAMENQIKWMDARRTPARSNVPDLLDYIHVDALKSVNPEKVKTIY